MLGLKIFKLQTLYELTAEKNELLRAQDEREAAEDDEKEGKEEAQSGEVSPFGVVEIDHAT